MEVNIWLRALSPKEIRILYILGLFEVDDDVVSLIRSQFAEE